MTKLSRIYFVCSLNFHSSFHGNPSGTCGDMTCRSINIALSMLTAEFTSKLRCHFGFAGGLEVKGLWTRVLLPRCAVSQNVSSSDCCTPKWEFKQSNFMSAVFGLVFFRESGPEILLVPPQPAVTGFPDSPARISWWGLSSLKPGVNTAGVCRWFYIDGCCAVWLSQSAKMSG